ncbi:hypothetical protein [uncultured Subdoligranulum sp.]|uniref:hypothetical protein n=1 Tax=uncultured Subdoligranulum sp. TaxID=512298 RepID=UPI0025D628BF|nr:hypothetical protein [uncultured Subdoligranulum sp.]
MYNRTFWLDHVEDEDGEVIQQGTLMDQAHFNNMEVGISDVALAAQIEAFRNIQEGYEMVGETTTVTLTTNSNPWPFCNTEKAVALSVMRNTKNYDVEVTVKSYSGGQIGNFEILDKALNGFKILHDGTAKSVTVMLKITGGMIA